MCKIIFLDIDGVLNSCKTFKENRIEKLLVSKISSNDIDTLVNKWMCDIDFEKVQLLKYVTEITGAKIVVSSSWRLLKYYIFIEERLINLGLPIIGKTDYINNNRGEEIRSYLEKNLVESFIILDDEISKDFDDLINHLVKTDFYVDGLNEEIADEVINILGVKQKIR